MKEFFKTTMIGGLLFLLPVALVLFILGYAVRTVANVVQPISKSLGLDRLVGGEVAGIGAVTVCAILLLVLVSAGRDSIRRFAVRPTGHGWTPFCIAGQD